MNKHAFYQGYIERLAEELVKRAQMPQARGPEALDTGGPPPIDPKAQDERSIKYLAGEAARGYQQNWENIERGRMEQARKPTGAASATISPQKPPQGYASASVGPGSSPSPSPSIMSRLRTGAGALADLTPPAMAAKWLNKR